MVEDKDVPKFQRKYIISPQYSIYCVHEKTLVRACFFGSDFVSIDEDGNLKYWALDADHQESFLLYNQSKLPINTAQMSNF